MRNLIVILLFALLVGIFALQNKDPLTIHFLFWTVPRISESLVIIGGVLLGAVLGALLVLREQFRRRKDGPPTNAPEDPGPNATPGP